jgi:PAS domain S-box-containing protein
MYVPLNAGDQRLGMLIARWVRRRKPRESVRRLAEAFARNAAVAVRGARLLDEARSVRAEADTMRRELETILDVAEESVVVFDREGRLIRANRRAVERITHLLGRFPDSFQDLAHQAGASQVGEGQLARLVGNVQRGQASSELLPVVGADGQVRQIQVHLAPARNAAGDVTAIVLLARDISELHDAIVERGRLDGAVKTARRAAHELNNSLSPLVGYGEMLARSLTGEDADLAGRMYQSALRAADLLNQLQRVIRFQQTEFGGQTMLDLDAATSPPAEPAHPT